MAPIRRPITLHDVARAAGVSYQTVSRVVNQHPHVAPATRQRVLAAVEELGYTPNRAARSLVTRRTQTLGIVSFGTRHYGPAQMVGHVERAFRDRGYGITISTLQSVSVEALERAVAELMRHQVDGIVMIVPIRGLDAGAVGRLTGSTPFVMVDVEKGSDLPSVVIDQEHGARRAVEHLHELGHARIAELHGPLDWVDAHARFVGMRAALAAVGLEPVLSVGGDWSPDSGYHAMRTMLDDGRAFSAVFVHNDQMALGALHALRDRGVRVPDDLSVVGFDDIPEAAHFAPPLTTVRQDFAALGFYSVDYLAHVLDDPSVAVHQRVIRPALKVRATTARWEAP